MAWRPAETVFMGGTEAALRLTGKRVRICRTRMGAYTSEPNGPGRKIDLIAGQLGFIGYVPADAQELLTIAFPRSGHLPESLDQLVCEPSFAMRVNWPTFR